MRYSEVITCVLYQTCLFLFTIYLRQFIISTRRIKSLYIDIGVHDLSIKNINSDKGLFDDASLFFVVSNNKQFNNYDMTINYGFGTGKIGSDYHNYDDGSGPSMSPFLSILLNTPYFNNKMNLIFEYDGQGINLGTQMPITDIYSLRFGISHINKITEWAKRAEENNGDLASTTVVGS